ncbi:hypothetical protein ACG92U_06695 [Leuconostoc citreum]
MALTLKFKNPEQVKEKIAMQGETIAGFSRRINVNYSLMVEYLNTKNFHHHQQPKR